jgi:glycosyltransferase involved in cell wall biosynthesis
MSDTIAVDASRLSVEHLTGTETYTAELLRAMTALSPPERFELYYNSSEPPVGAPLLGEPVCIPFPRLWTHARLAIELRRRRPSLLFVPAHVVPALHPKSVVTIHDLGYLHYPESHPPSQLRMLNLTTRWSAHAAKRIIAISTFTKNDLVEHYHVDPAKIDVVHHGVSAAFEPSTQSEAERVRAQYHLPDRFLLAVGTVQPRKNYGRLARALALLGPDDSIELIIAGKRGWMADEVELEVAESRARVRWLGYVPDRDLPALYSAATIVCQPSLFEGFGMPAIEAMACGAPVIASTGSALPEICGEAARFVAPTETSSIASAIAELLTDEQQRRTFAAAGLARAAAFSWRSCAVQTLDVLRTALKS